MVIVAAASDYDKRVPLDQGDGGACLDVIRAALEREWNQEADELLEFLQHFQSIYPYLNDTFNYASADTERISLDIDARDEDYVANGEVLVKVWRKYGVAGIRAFVAKMRGTEPLKELQDDAYRAAMTELEGWEYEPD